jgi:hypothetical protein
MAEVTYRTYEEGDEGDILQMYNRVFPATQSARRWRWAFRSGPVNRMDVILALAGTRIIGQSAGVPQRLERDGCMLSASRIQNVGVDADFRGRGIFLETISRLTDSLQKSGVDCIVGFPNDNSLPAFLKLGYRHLFDVFQFHGPVPKATVDEGLTAEISEARNFQTSDITFIERALPAAGILRTVRDAAYLSWRYAPESGNAYWVTRVCRNGELAGFAVSKGYEAGRSVDILEFVTDGDPAVARALLSATATSYGRGADGGITLWAMDHYREFEYLRSSGFTATNRSSHFIWKDLSGRSGLREARADFYLTMGDSDVF